MARSAKIDLVFRAMKALNLLQIELVAKTGASRRTVQRWFAGQSAPWAAHFEALARETFPVDPGLAAELAAAAETTLDALGLAATVPTPPLDDSELVDSIVCAAAEAVGLSPRDVRPVLLAAFARARSLRLDVARVEHGLRTRAAPA